MPTARQPCSLASWPTTEPTAPDAAETTTVSPALGLPICIRPHHAVMPGMPSTDKAADNGAALGSSLVTMAPFDTAKLCQPEYSATKSPSLNLGFFDFTTWPTVPPTMASPRLTLAA